MSRDEVPQRPASDPIPTYPEQVVRRARFLRPDPDIPRSAITRPRTGRSADYLPRNIT
jgi:hypothetical protein